MSKSNQAPGTGAVLAAVNATVEQRKETMPENSYVAKLLRKGTDTICCKIAEEAGETVKAAREQSDQQLTKELCDLLFHVLVLMTHKDISLADLEAELARRHGISGLDEKASRKK